MHNKAFQIEEEIQDPIEFSDEVYEARLRLIRQAVEDAYSQPANDDDFGEFEI